MNPIHDGSHLQTLSHGVSIDSIDNELFCFCGNMYGNTIHTFANLINIFQTYQ